MDKEKKIAEGLTLLILNHLKGSDGKGFADNKDLIIATDGMRIAEALGYFPIVQLIELRKEYDAILNRNPNDLLHYNH